MVGILDGESVKSRCWLCEGAGRLEDMGMGCPSTESQGERLVTLGTSSKVKRGFLGGAPEAVRGTSLEFKGEKRESNNEYL